MPPARSAPKPALRPRQLQTPGDSPGGPHLSCFARRLPADSFRGIALITSSYFAPSLCLSDFRINHASLDVCSVRQEGNGVMNPKCYKSVNSCWRGLAGNEAESGRSKRPGALLDVKFD